MSAARARAQVVGALRSQLRSLKIVNVTINKEIQQNWLKKSLASTRELILALHYSRLFTFIHILKGAT